MDKKLQVILRHIETVRGNCEKLAEKLDENKEQEFSRRLIANSLIHDNSKLDGIEWDYLNDETKESHPDKFKLALEHHQHSNPHHIEHYLDFTEMPRLYIAELVCDVSARSSEFGEDVKEWFKDRFTIKYKMSKNSAFYKEAKSFMDMLLDRPFK